MKKVHVFLDYSEDFWRENVILWNFFQSNFWNVKQVYINNCNAMWQLLKTMTLAFVLTKYQSSNVLWLKSWITKCYSINKQSKSLKTFHEFLPSSMIFQEISRFSRYLRFFKFSQIFRLSLSASNLVLESISSKGLSCLIVLGRGSNMERWLKNMPHLTKCWVRINKRLYV